MPDQIRRPASVACGASTPLLRSARLLLVSMVLAVAVSGPAGSRTALATPQPRTAAYKLDANVDLGAGLVDTNEVVRYRNVVGVPLQSIVFRVVPNVVGSFALRRATVDGKDVTWSLDGSVLELPLAAPIAPDATTEVGLTFSIAPPNTPGRLAATPHGMALGNWFPIVAVYREHWDRRQYVDTGDAFFSEVADYDLNVRSTNAAEIVATGQRVDTGEPGAHFVAQNVRDLAVAISPDYVTRQAMVGQTTLIAATTSGARSTAYLNRGAEF